MIICFIILDFMPTYLKYKYIFFFISISGRIRSRIRIRIRGKKFRILIPGICIIFMYLGLGCPLRRPRCWRRARAGRARQGECSGKLYFQWRLCNEKLVIDFIMLNMDQLSTKCFVWFYASIKPTKVFCIPTNMTCFL